MQRLYVHFLLASRHGRGEIAERGAVRTFRLRNGMADASVSAAPPAFMERLKSSTGCSLICLGIVLPCAPRAQSKKTSVKPHAFFMLFGYMYTNYLKS